MRGPGMEEKDDQDQGKWRRATGQATIEGMAC